MSFAWGQEASVKLAYAACRTEAAFIKFDDLRRSSDSDAFGKYLRATYLSGICIPLKVGEPVYKEGYGEGSRIIKIRPKGEIESYFTYDVVIK
jgi:hypothetical protein